MNISGIGIDAVNIKRFKEAFAKHGEGFLEKIFTDKEIAYARTKNMNAVHLAGKFAAKEAVKKALPDGASIGLNWLEIEILNDEDGKPYVNLYGAAKETLDRNGLSRILVSISHTKDIALSNAIGVKNG